MSEKTTWYLIRAGGLVAWGLLAASIIFGLLLASRLMSARRATAWTLSVHRFLGGLSVLFTGIHLVALHLDDFVDFGVLDFVIPFRDTWRPGAVAWGVISLWLMLAVEGSSLAMRHLPKKVWRMVHFLSVPLFITATVHGFLAGSDTGRIFMAVTVAVVVFLVCLTIVRVVARRRWGAPSDLADAAPTAKTNVPSSTAPKLTETTPTVAAVAPATSAATAPATLADAMPSLDELPVIDEAERNAQPLGVPPRRGASALPSINL